VSHLSPPAHVSPLRRGLYREISSTRRVKT
jgi:hypothetical protein